MPYDNACHAQHLTYDKTGVTMRGLMAPGYRPPSEEPRGRWARHIHAYRKANGLNATAAFEMWHAGLGMAAKSRTAYLAIDTGKREPTQHEAEYLASVMGYPPESPQEPLGATESHDQLAAAINALVAELRAMREEREAIEARLRALEAVSPHALPEGAALPERSVPRG